MSHQLRKPIIIMKFYSRRQFGADSYH